MSVRSLGYRLSPQQKRAWQLLVANNGKSYIVEGVILIEGRIEPSMIEESLDDIFQRHEILRTEFQSLPGASMPIQVVSERKFHFDQVLDLSYLDQAKQEAEVDKLRQEAVRPFPIFEQGALIRADLVLLSAEQKLLLLSLPAVCSDRTGLVNLTLELGRHHVARLGQTDTRNGQMQYADLAGVLNSFFELDEMQDGREYWRAQIDTELFKVKLPYAAPVSYQQEFFPKYISRRLDSDHICGDEEWLVSPLTWASTYLLACYASLLHRLTGSSNLMIGMAFPVRSYEELASTIGPLEKYLPVRCRIEPGMTLAHLVRQLSADCQEAEVWQESFTWDDVKIASGEDRELLFFSFQFEYWEIPEAIPTSPVRISLIETQGNSERFDLKLSCVRHADALNLRLYYDPSVLRADTATRFADEIVTLIQSANGRQNEAIDHLNILSQGEWNELLALATGPEIPIPVGRYIHELIDQQAPQAIAVTFEDTELSYDQLATSSNQLARYLQSLGTGEGVKVGVCLKRSPDVIVSILGILKSGGVYVPLDPESPQERLTQILKDADIRIVLTHSDMAGRLPDVGAVLVRLDSEGEGIACHSAERVYPDISPESLAYVIYTSGSTGTPKGVGVSHGNLLNSTMARRRFYEGAPDRFLLLSPFHFDSSVAGIFWTLLEGGALALPPENAQRDPMQITKLIARDRISHLLALPSLYRYILEAANPEQTSSLQTAIVAGEACPPNLPRLHQGKTANADLFNEYGPTESTVWSTAYLCAVDSTEMRIPIGKPIANTQVYVVERSGGLTPMGVPGELLIGGRGVTRGYLNQAGATAERFVPNSFSCQAGERMYRTGDLVRWREDGELEFLGRIDHQVKVRGHRIELGEIEAALSSHDRVKQSVVVFTEDEGGDNRLVGYVVGKEGVTAAELKIHVRERLPAYMVPEAIMMLEELPLTATGKVDRRRLPTAQGAGRQVEQEYVVARTPVEEIVIGIFESVLKLDRIGIFDNFFELGGHSLLATQVISKVMAVFGIELGVRSIFEEPTVEVLARKIEEIMRGKEPAEAPPLVRVSREGKLPLSFAQQRLWVLDQLMPNNPLYNGSGAVRVEGRLNLDVLKIVINEIVRRHEVLRTRIEVEAGSPAQVIDEWEPRGLKVDDLTGLTHEELELEVKRIINEEAKTGFDLRRGPLMRLRVLELEKEEHIVVFTMHHIASDAWSMGVLVREMGVLYEAINAGERPPLPELKIQYADYAAWQRKYLVGTVLEKHLAYWKKQLSGKLPALDLPTDRLRPPVPSYRGAAKSFSLSMELFQSLRALSRRERVTLFILLLAAFKTLLYKYTAQEDIIVGTAIANRNRVEIEPLIGFFVNMLPLRADLSGNPRFTELLKQVRAVAIGGYAHQDLPFERLVKEIQPERTVWEMPLFNVAFGVQNAPEEELRLNGLEVRPIVTEQGNARYDLTLWVREGIQEIQVEWTYSKDLFEESTIVRVHNHFETLLSSIVDRPDARLINLDISPRAEAGLNYEGQRGWDDSDMGEPTSIKRRGISLPTEPAC